MIMCFAPQIHNTAWANWQARMSGQKRMFYIITCILIRQILSEIRTIYFTSQHTTTVSIIKITLI